MTRAVTGEKDPSSVGTVAPGLQRADRVGAAAAGRAHRQGRSRAPRRSGGRAVALFVGPYALFLVLFGIAPAVYGGYVSLSSQATGGATTIGLGNWLGVFTDYRLVDSAKHVAAYLGIWLPVLVVLVMGLALMLHDRPGKFGSTMRFVYYLPGAITGSAAAVLWLFMMTPSVSPFGWLLRPLGISSLTDAVSGNGLPVLLAIIGLAIHAGGWIVVVYGALATLPRDVLDAARVDGCSAWQVAWHIKLPLVRRFIALMLITTFAAGTQVFVEPTVLAKGAPGQISPTWSLNQLAYYYATQEGNFGRAAALSIALLIVGLGAALIVVFRTRFYSHDIHKTS